MIHVQNLEFATDTWYSRQPDGSADLDVGRLTDFHPEDIKGRGRERLAQMRQLDNRTVAVSTHFTLLQAPSTAP
jgi:hypothetical protein